MAYRIELDALNALVDEQKRTNELLERLIGMNTTEKTPAIEPDNTQKQRRGRQKK